MNAEEKENEQTDILKNGLKIIQNPNAFMFGIDAVLLACFANIRRNSKVIDLGTGNGIIPLLMSTMHETASFTGLEIQKESASLAKRSVSLNGLDERIEIIEGDIKECGTLFAHNCADAVVSNPPYMTASQGKQNPDERKNIARHEVLCSIHDIARAVNHIMKDNGSFFMIHRPYRLPEIFKAFSEFNLEVKRLRLVSSTVADEPSMVLLEIKKNAKPYLKIENNLIVYKEKNVYSDEVLSFFERIEKSGKTFGRN